MSQYEEAVENEGKSHVPTCTFTKYVVKFKLHILL